MVSHTWGQTNYFNFIYFICQHYGKCEVRRKEINSSFISEGFEEPMIVQRSNMHEE